MYRILAFLLLLPLHAGGATAQPLTILTSFSEPIYEQIRAGFNQVHPDIELRFINKKTVAALSHLNEAMTPQADLFMASAPDAFAWLEKNQLLLTYQSKNSQAQTHTSFAVSGYGFMLDHTALTDKNLTPPQSFEQLLQPKYRALIGMSSPMRSGTTHIIVESQLQNLGWEAGWQYWVELSGNLATITARSFGVPQGILQKRFNIGLVIDFMALGEMHQNPQISLAYPTPVTLMPVNIGIIRGTQLRTQASQFIDYLLSDRGQELLLHPKLSRYPIELLKQKKQVKSNHHLRSYYPHDKERCNFNIALSSNRYHLVNALFDTLITTRLNDLQTFWQRFHELSTQVQSISKPQQQATLFKQLSQAHHNATLVPLKQTQLTDQHLLDSFSNIRPGNILSETQLAEQKRWKQFINQHFKEANKILQDVEDTIKDAEQGEQ